LPARNKLLFFEALQFQFISGLILKLVPFRKIPRLFEMPSHFRSSESDHESQISLLKSSEIRHAITISGGLSPWKNKCLVQSLAARWMLNRRGISSQLSLGVALGPEKKMIAHAWLKVNDFEIVERRNDYVELYIF
jgi:hypothetical protein